MPSRPPKRDPVRGRAPSFPKADPATVAFVRELSARDPRIVARPMFGHVAGFVNGHMGVCAFGPDVALRLDEDDRAALLRMPGATPFEPMPGRPMREYVTLPRDWSSRGDWTLEWVDRAVRALAARPPKVPAARGGRAGR